MIGDIERAKDIAVDEAGGGAKSCIGRVFGQDGVTVADQAVRAYEVDEALCAHTQDEAQKDEMTMDKSSFIGAEGWYRVGSRSLYRYVHGLLE